MDRRNFSKSIALGALAGAVGVKQADAKPTPKAFTNPSSFFKLINKNKDLLPKYFKVDPDAVFSPGMIAGLKDGKCVVNDGSMPTLGIIDDTRYNLCEHCDCRGFDSTIGSDNVTVWGRWHKDDYLVIETSAYDHSTTYEKGERIAVSKNGLFSKDLGKIRTTTTLGNILEVLDNSIVLSYSPMVFPEFKDGKPTGCFGILLDD